MASPPPGRASFEVHLDDDHPADALIAGFSEQGLAGLTAAEYLVERLDLSQTGYVAAEELPTITPFEDGKPRHPVRIYAADEVDVAVLVSELFVPVFAAEPFTDALLSWTAESGVDEIAVASGVAMPHADADHRTFYVATEDFRETRLDGVDVPPMARGFLDGFNASLLNRGIDSDLRAGVFVTPAHPQAPDVGAALRLVETVAGAFDLDVDTAPLESFAAEIERHYQNLAERMERAAEEQKPEDRMYM